MIDAPDQKSRFNLSALAVRERAVTLFFIVIISIAGIVAFLSLGRAEDPGFTIKVMTVVTSWPDLSTSIAHIAPVSSRKRRSDPVIAPKSSSVKVQLAAPAVILVERRLDAVEQLHSTLTEKRARLPGDVFAQQLCRANRRARAEKAQRRNAPQTPRTEKIAAVSPLHSRPQQRSGGKAADESDGDKPASGSPHVIVRRAVSACAIVTPSAYSRSPPTGNPRAMRETVSGSLAILR